MADGTIPQLRLNASQTYWDQDKRHPYADLRYNEWRHTWNFGVIELHEDLDETTPTKVVLRSKVFRDGTAVKIVVPQAEGALKPAAAELGIVHVCPFYKGVPGYLEYQGSLFIFAGGF